MLLIRCITGNLFELLVYLFFFILPPPLLVYFVQLSPVRMFLSSLVLWYTVQNTLHFSCPFFILFYFILFIYKYSTEIREKIILFLFLLRS